MAENPSEKPIGGYVLPRISDRCSFLYLERCRLHRDQNALTVTDESGVTNVPAAALACVLLGPGSVITHAAVSLLGDCGVSLIWVGEMGVRFYASGRSIARNTRLLEAQAKLVTNTRSRLKIAKLMYAMRFSGEELEEGLTLHQLRGREGARMRRLYRQQAKEHGVPWHSRSYDPKDFLASDPINQALTAGSVALYGIAHAVITALGCSPGLGFIHTGKDQSFVYDIADLYKAEISIPAAFKVIADGSTDPGSDTRRVVRDFVVREKLLARCARDIVSLIAPDIDVEWEQIDRLQLWSGNVNENIVAGYNWSDQ